MDGRTDVEVGYQFSWLWGFAIMLLARDSKKKNLFVSSVHLIESDRIQSVQK